MSLISPPAIVAPGPRVSSGASNYWSASGCARWASGLPDPQVATVAFLARTGHRATSHGPAHADGSQCGNITSGHQFWSARTRLSSWSWSWSWSSEIKLAAPRCSASSKAIPQLTDLDEPANAFHATSSACDRQSSCLKNVNSCGPEWAFLWGCARREPRR
jgi:hypothetical protein